MRIAETSSGLVTNPVLPLPGSEPAAQLTSFTADLLRYLAGETDSKIIDVSVRTPPSADNIDRSQSGNTGMLPPPKGRGSVNVPSLKADPQRKRSGEAALMVDPFVTIPILPFSPDLSFWLKQAALPNDMQNDGPNKSSSDLPHSVATSAVLANMSSPEQVIPDLSFAAQLTLAPPATTGLQQKTQADLAHPVSDKNVSPALEINLSSNMREQASGSNNSAEENPKTLASALVDIPSSMHAPFALASQAQNGPSVQTQMPPSFNPAKSSAPPQPTGELNETHSSRVAPVLKEIGLKIDIAPSAGVSLQLVERSGGLHVAVRTHDADLGRSLQNNLTDLVCSLKREGVDMETWTPHEAHMGDSLSDHGSTNPDKNESHANSHGRSNREGTTQQNPSSRRDNPQRNRRPDWVRNLDFSFLASFTN